MRSDAEVAAVSEPLQLPPPGFGAPIDFGPSLERKRRNEANPIIWGAWGGIAAAVIATIAALAQQLQPSQTVWGFGMGGFFWMAAVARIWNWLGRRR